MVRLNAPLLTSSLLHEYSLYPQARQYTDNYPITIPSHSFVRFPRGSRKHSLPPLTLLSIDITILHISHYVLLLDHQYG